jgi:hypothetical protein
MVVAAEVLLVVALVALNLYLWIRPGHDDGAHSGATSTGASVAASDATPAAGSVGSGSPDSATTGPAGTTTTATTATQSATDSSTAGATTSSSGPAPTASSVPGAAPAPVVSPAIALKAAGRLVAVVDTSQGMADQLGAVKDGLTELAKQAPDGVALGLITYGANGIEAVVTPEPLDANRRTNFVSAVEALTTTAKPDRPLLDGLVLAYQYALAGPPGTDPAPIVMAITNGGRTQGSDLQTFAVFAQAESAKRARSATPSFIGLTPGADVPLLTRTAAAAGGGKVVSVSGANRLRDAILDLPAPRPASSIAGSSS